MERDESETRNRALEQMHLFDWSEVRSGRKRIKEQDAAMRKMQKELDEMKKNKREEKAASQSEMEKLQVGIHLCLIDFDKLTTPHPRHFSQPPKKSWSGRRKRATPMSVSTWLKGVRC